MKNRVILNWVPPGLIHLPSIPMSVLKSYLNSEGYEVKVIYWNILLKKLQQQFIFYAQTEDIYAPLDLILFSNYYAYYSNKTIDPKIKTLLISYFKENAYASFFDDHMKSFAEKLDNLMDMYILKIDFKKILFIGFSVSMNQWICASLLASKIKQIAPHIPIVIGGMGTKESAKAFLNAFAQFDIAIWGEGEYPLSVLCKELKKANPDFNTIPHTVYRNHDENIVISSWSHHDYINLDSLSIRPDYSDFFHTIRNTPDIEILPELFVECARSCNWNKCHFCYFSKGYKYRRKSIQAIINELEYNINKYRIYDFTFIANDIVGGDVDAFNKLLDSLIKLKKKHPLFSVKMAGFITNGLDSKTIHKLFLAGFNGAQIGYESLSDNLLRKIEKRNTVASNILFIKFASFYNIRVTDSNIIKNLLEETDEDILECIENLHYLRFFFRKGWFKHNNSQLAISTASKYYRKILDTMELWKNNNILFTLLPSSFYQNTLNDSIIELLKSKYNRLWDSFFQKEAFYLNNDYKYTLIKKNTKEINYTEYKNSEVINQIIFHINDLKWSILTTCNEKVVSLKEISRKIEISDMDALIKAINELKDQKLLYESREYTEIISIINTNIIY